MGERDHLTTMPWNPDRYHQFQKERSAPFEDALALVTVRAGLRVVDLGCGTGELTRRLADALPDCDALGLDSSAEMLAKAAPHARPGLRFEQGSIEDFASGEGEADYDLIFSHAALQWVDDHQRLIPRLFQRVRSGGQFVAQMPHNFSHTAHRLIRDTAAEAPFAAHLGGWSPIPIRAVLEIDRYAELFFAAGAAAITVFEKVYPHLLADADAVADWTSGTALVPYAERLGDAYPAFMERYRAKLREALPESPLFYGFRRILWGVTRQ